jgi:hypothetical protein
LLDLLIQIKVVLLDRIQFEQHLPSFQRPDLKQLSNDGSASQQQDDKADDWKLQNKKTSKLLVLSPNVL